MSRVVLLTDLMARNVDYQPEKRAVLAGQEAWSYSDIDEMTRARCSALQQVGLGKRDRALILLPNGIDAVVSFFAVLRAGGIACILHPAAKARSLRQIVADAEPSQLITDAEHLSTVEAAGLPDSVNVLSTDPNGTRRYPRCVDLSPLEQQPGPRREPYLIDQDVAFLVYTSGSTGTAKGVMCTHAASIAAIHSITQYLRNDRDDVVVDVLPLSFDHGLYQVLTMFYVGGTVLLERDFTLPQATLRRMAAARVTGFPGVPSIFALLLRLELSRYDLPALRYLSSTGAVLPAPHIKALRRAFPRADIFSMYGLTECKRVAYLPPEEIDRRPSSVGRAIPNEEVWLVDEQGHTVETGEIGELVVRGSNVMAGYWRRPAESDLVFRPGLYHGERVLYTGDLMRMDSEGFLYFIGRKDDLLKSSGYKVYPHEIEDVLYSLPTIAEAAVIGQPHDTLGEVIVAHVVLRPGVSLSIREIIEFCQRELEPFKVPREVIVHNALPRTGAGKIDRQLLRLANRGRA